MFHQAVVSAGKTGGKSCCICSHGTASAPRIPTPQSEFIHNLDQSQPSGTSTDIYHVWLDNRSSSLAAVVPHAQFIHSHTARTLWIMVWVSIPPCVVLELPGGTQQLEGKPVLPVVCTCPNNSKSGLKAALGCMATKLDISIRNSES